MGVTALGAPLPTDPTLYFSTHVFVCGNRRPEDHERGCCASKGSERIRDYMKARVKELKIKGVRINQAGCLYPEGVWYRLDSTEAVEAVIERHIQQGGRVAELLLEETK